MSTQPEPDTPLIPAGGSLLIAWQLKNKNVLIVGGGEVASTRVESLLVTDAHLIVLSPTDGLCERTTELIKQYPARVTHHDRLFGGDSELQNVDMVLTAIDDVVQSQEIVDLCRERRIPVNAADIPDCCDFYFGAQIRDGPLQIMISTNGNGPKVASLIKSKLQKSLSGNEGKAIEKIGRLREMLKERAPGVGGPVGRRRMKWMSQVCTQWDLASFAQLDEASMKKMLDLGWPTNHVPSRTEVFGIRSSTLLPARASEALHDRTAARDISTSTKFILPLAVGFTVGVFSTFVISALRRR
jgi:precorrin-2 dehydrogenase / sirohydrochlorin ferrochelatase